MYTIGLTGGIASGKSEVSRVLERLGAVVIDADILARRMVEPGTPALAAIVDAFGREILLPDGTLDRQRLGAEVFASKESLSMLNGIVHPPLVEAIRGAVRERRRDPGVLVVDAALLVEWGITGDFDLTVAVVSPLDERLKRLEGEGLAREEALARIDAQLPDEVVLAAADVIIENDGTLEALRASAERLWDTVKNRDAEAR